MTIKMIVASTTKGYIGLNGDLLYKLKQDMIHFKTTTLNSIVVSGRKTFESIPSILPKRVNVVLTSDREYQAPSGVFVTHSKEQIVNNYITSGSQSKDVFIIGGSYLYNQFLEDVDMVYLTRIKDDDTIGDVKFPLELMEEKFICMKFNSYIEDGIEFTIEEWIKEDYKEEYYKKKPSLD